ncbi:MAG: copper homeostasis protein CutC [Crocinitomix sp.]|nr:copper homeostasis protein CutC [Crocinitomix sp.]
MDVEVCIDSVEGTIVASKYGAKRVELCSALSEGGLSPSLAMIEACVNNSTAEVFVMIRPSAGGFNYTEAELELMERDIRAASSVGAHGVVFGVLNGLNEVDIKANLFLIETAMELKLGTTFHRAIDLCSDVEKALEGLINLGFDRVLSSGGCSNAAKGLERIKKMVECAQGSIEIMAGAGVDAENVLEIISSGVDAVHFTAKKRIDEDLALDMGPKYVVDDEKIREIIALTALI